MFDYAAWLRRLIAFMEGLRGLPGDIKVEIEGAPPITRSELSSLLAGLPRPVPECLIRFWTEAASFCRCTYSWTIPAQFDHQWKAASVRHGSHIWGGVEFVPTWLDGDYHVNWPSDDLRERRICGNSLALMHNGGGDSLGVYMLHPADDPPMVWMSHEGCSRMLGMSFNELLDKWERVGYIGLDLFFDPDAAPRSAEALRSMLAGQVLTHVVCDIGAEPEMTPRIWAEATAPQLLVKFLLCRLGQIGRDLSWRKKRLFLMPARLADVRPGVPACDRGRGAIRQRPVHG